MPAGVAIPILQQQGVAQFGRACGLGPQGRRFKSCLPDFSAASPIFLSPTNRSVLTTDQSVGTVWVLAASSQPQVQAAAAAHPEAKRRAILGPDGLLDAAEAVILRESIGKLTLDAVAAEAGASKGGLIHHFPSKEKLLEAMVARIVANWRSDTLSAIAATPAGPGRVPRAMLDILEFRGDEWCEQCKRSSRVLIAALVSFPSLIEPMQKFHRELASLIAADGLPPGVGEAVIRCTDGLWFMWQFGLEDLQSSRTKAMIEVLREIVAKALGGPVKSSVPKPRKRVGSANKTKSLASKQSAKPVKRGS